MFTVTIDETNSIIHTVTKKFGVDLTGMSMASLRLRISQFCKDQHIQSPGNIVSRFSDDPGFIESFMLGISVGSPDMFRDPDMWIMLREQILPGMILDDKKPGIMIPGCVTGDELYSMAILLKESGLDEQINLTATCMHNSLKKQIDNGPLSKGRYKNCQDNYQAFNPGSPFEKYITFRAGKYFRKPGLLDKVTINVQGLDHLDSTRSTKLLLYRNRMIYYNQDASRRIINIILDQVPKGTILIIGIKESVNHLGLEDRIEFISSDLNIFSKTG